MINEEESRLKKLDQIKKQGIDPYLSQGDQISKIVEIQKNFDHWFQKERLVKMAGRIRSIRMHGKSCFAHLEDETGRFQIYLKYDLLGEEKYNFFVDLIDVGDFVSTEGKLFLTKKGEQTILVENYQLLTKSLLPLPEKWHGLSDIELRFRKRYLDLLANPEIKEIFQKRSLIIKLTRQFFDELGFIEVETPILQPIPGGANARPFVTHHHALDIDLYLRIAPELYLKRLIIGGFEKVYEIARCFRNEGIDRAHNPEFTQIEFYQAYADYQNLMTLTEKFLEFLLEKIEGKLEIEYQGEKIRTRPSTSSGQNIVFSKEENYIQKINFKAPYTRLSFRQALIDFVQIDIEKFKTREQIATKAKNIGLKVDRSWGRGKILDELYKEFIRPKIIQPTFIIDHPIELSPLAKKKTDNPDYVERFQLIVAGMEVCNAFSELNDPLDQEERFREQQKMREAGDEEAHRIDYDFIEALKYGMPPTAGEGIGIDRLATILCNVHNVKEVIIFPTMRSKEK